MERDLGKMLHVKHSDFSENEKLKKYVELLMKWQAKINLIGPETISEIWMRHIADSAQVASCISDGESVADLGSGGGFPGIVLAILNPTLKVRLVEADKRKCAFLSEVKIKLGLNIEVVNRRIEETELKNDVVTARALTEIENLLTMTIKNIKNDTRFVLLKGEKVEIELNKAQEKFHFDVERYPSETDKTGTIVILRRVQCL